MARNIGDLRTDTHRNIDMRVHKNFPVYDRLSVQFPAETFNVIKQVVFATPDS